MKVAMMSQIVDKVSDLVRLRRWALSVLQSDSSALAPRDYPAVSAASMQLFLEIERCAAPLAESLGRAGASLRVPAEANSAIAAAALDDAKQALRAEREAREIGTALGARNMNAIVLKGGVPAVLRVTPPLTLHDVDLLVTSQVRKPLEEILKARGFTAAESDERHHTCWYPPQGRLPVEIHWTTHSDGQPEHPAVWLNVVPLPKIAGLCRLGWADQVVHLVRHAIEQHIDRHVTVRDLLLTGWFVNQLSQGDIEKVEERIAVSGNPTRSRAFLDFCRAVYRRQSISDPFEDDAILHFAATVMVRKRSLWAGGPLPAWHNAATVAAGVMSLPQLVMFAARSPVTGIGAFAAFQQHAPQIGALLTRGARAAHYFSSAVIGVPVLKTVRGKVRDQLAHESS